MSRVIPEDLFHQLALAVADGTRVSTWCADNGVAKRTAYDWHKRAEFQRLVVEYRRRAEDRAIGKIAKDLSKAVAKVIQLIEEGLDDHVKLLAAEVLIDKLLHIQSHVEFWDELRQLDERVTAREKRRETGPDLLSIADDQG